MTFTSFALGQLIFACDAVAGNTHVVSYLPLSHIAGQIADMYCLICLGGTTWFAQPDALKGTLGDTLREVRPHFFFGVPRVWEKIMERIQVQGRTLTGFKKWLSGWAKGKALEGNRNIEKGLPTPWGFTIASMILKKVRVATGLDRCVVQFTGAAPIGRETLEFYQSLNIPLCELYGMSECTGPQNVSSVGKSELGKCGPPFEESCEIRIDNPDEKGEGEVMQ
jgi:long-chain-fatty-acid--CoA ligase ACSBG